MLNDDKLEVLRYSISKSKSTDHHYISPAGTAIKEEEVVKDLGVLMSSNGSFTEHINKLQCKLRNMSSWILRTFQSREKEVMKTMWKTLAIPLHDYCSQLWSPHKKKRNSTTREHST